MKANDRRHERGATMGWKAALLMTLAGVVAGCSSQPAVEPLLRVSEQALSEEIERLAYDVQRDEQRIEQTRQALEQAFDADLDQRDELDAQWVRSATGAYVIAREQLVRHEMTLQREREDRAANLQAAGDAIEQARLLLEQRDALWERMLPQHWRLWRFSASNG